MNVNVLRGIQTRKKANDVFYTPLKVVNIMINMCDIKENEKVLDPCKGKGAFYDNLPLCNKFWCEITDDKDFFKWDKQVDCIIGNVPYSLWNKFLDHTIKYCNRFCYIFGLGNLTPHRIKRLEEEGFFITKIHILRVDWWSVASFICLFEKNKKSIITATKHHIQCSKCGKRCGRGKIRKGVRQNPNICYLETLKNIKK